MVKIIIMFLSRDLVQLMYNSLHFFSDTPKEDVTIRYLKWSQNLPFLFSWLVELSGIILFRSTSMLLALKGIIYMFSIVIQCHICQWFLNELYVQQELNTRLCTLLIMYFNSAEMVTKSKGFDLKASCLLELIDPLYKIAY